MSRILMTGLALAACSGAAWAASAAGKPCEGVFLRASSGQAIVEGSDLEPSADRRAKGTRARFIGFDVFAGRRYYLVDGGDLHAAPAVRLDRGCRLGKVTQY